MKDKIYQRHINIDKLKIDNQINCQFFTTNYFIKSQKILLAKAKHNNTCTMQFIHFSDFIVMSGKQEIIEILRFCLSPEQLKRTTIYIADDNMILDANTPLLVITGYYTDFGWLENILDGILSRRCSVATNTYYLQKSLLNHQKIIYMADRINNYFDQSFDAYPAYLQGIDLFVTQAQISLFEHDKNVSVVGTIPHALIQQYQNNLVEMVNDYIEIFPNTPLYCLIDFENDVIKSLNQLKPVMHNIAGVRIDTSSKLVDQSLIGTNEFGVNPKLINLVKQWLINNNFHHVKIVVTSSIDAKKIQKINMQTNAVDIYGVGSAFNKNSVHVSADLVKINGKNFAKVGRQYLNNAKKLKKIDFFAK